MDILITGARAPVTIDWARIAIRSGHRVWLADSMHWPIGRFLKGIQGYLRLPSANENGELYRATLLRYVLDYSIDMIIPTCEEIFHISAVRDSFENLTDFYAPDHELLIQLHDKYRSMQLLDGLGVVRTPETRLCSSINDIADSCDTILKPVFSRFAQHVIREVDKTTLTDLDISIERPWVQQEKITGKAVCNYAVMEHGRVVVHQAYLPRYCLNDAASTFFEPHTDVRLDTFVREFGERTQYHGQVAFDFIEQDGELYVIECNPRATSGLHLLRESVAIDEQGAFLYAPKKAKAFHVGATLPLFFGLKSLLSGTWNKFCEDYRRADNVFTHDEVHLKKRAQWLALIELTFLSCIKCKPLTEVTTHDIQWESSHA